jgi:phosphoglycolate phosphatase
MRHDFEIRIPFQPRPQITHAIFDFDGTLSWLRHGWPRLMQELFLEYLPRPAGSGSDELADSLLSELLSLNGKPTIFQMEAFVARVHATGASVPTAEELRQQYQGRLDEAIARRSGRIRQSGDSEPFVVHGARAFLERLAARGLVLIILSGTVEHRVREEAALLRLSDFFGKHIYGAPADQSSFSKRAVMDRLLAEENLEGARLVSFGDGPVEIRETRALGGLAIGVASHEEHNGSGQVDTHKRIQLINAGAHAIVADYEGPDVLLQRIFGA